MENHDVEGHEHREEKLSDKSYIQVGLIVTIVGFIVGAVWWAATMDSKLNQVIEEVKATHVMQTKVAENETRIKILEMRVDRAEACVKKGP